MIYSSDYTKIHRKLLLVLSIALAALLMTKLNAQTFVKITDPGNPVSNVQGSQNYNGATWIDYNNDGDLDLFVAPAALLKNEGGGAFSLVNANIGSGQQGQAAGPSWSDYDNDGDADLFLASAPSYLYRNDGGDNFTKITEGEVSPTLIDNRGWASAWGDYNNDGFADLFVTHPQGFLGFPALSNHLYLNNGDGRLTKILDYDFTSTLLAPYTVATWYDYDMDNDIDLFIASGPATGPIAPDYLYKNTLTENSEAGFQKIATNPIATDDQDGQVWNWIDFDNDGDYDAYLTNYAGVRNKFYRNDNGTYVDVQNALTFQGAYLANSWGDLDNDGDLDVVITGEAQVHYFINNGDGTFSGQAAAFAQAGGGRGAIFGDYDNDGDLDVYISGVNAVQGLFQNTSTSSNNWVQFKLEGTVSNRSALGAKIRVKAVIDGQPVWQIREVNAQNSFGSHNALRAHFGLKDASIIDSMIVQWPSGQLSVQTNVQTNQIYEIAEEIPVDFLRANFTVDNVNAFKSEPISFSDLSLNGANAVITQWEWDFNSDGTIDATDQNPVWSYNTQGSYSVSLTVRAGAQSETILRQNYVVVKSLPGIPNLISSFPVSTDTTIAKNGQIKFKVNAADTTGYELSYKWYRNGVPGIGDTTYNYKSSILFPAPRTDTVKVEISNIQNTTTRTWYVHVEDNVSSVEEKGGIPTEFNLAQNYPNPFNPSTSIEFSVPEASFVSLKVYDVTGKEVAVLVERELNAGNYSKIFDTSKLSSGIYFYRIQAGNFVKTSKMTLLK